MLTNDWRHLSNARHLNSLVFKVIIEQLLLSSVLIFNWFEFLLLIVNLFVISSHYKSVILLHVQYQYAVLHLLSCLCFWVSAIKILNINLFSFIFMQSMALVPRALLLIVTMSAVTSSVATLPLSSQPSNSAKHGIRDWLLSYHLANKLTWVECWPPNGTWFFIQMFWLQFFGNFVAACLIPVQWTAF